METAGRESRPGELQIYLNKYLGFSDLTVLSMTPRQIQIKQFELEQLLLLDNVKEFIKNNGKIEDLMADNPLYIKWCELKGINLEDNDGVVNTDVLGLSETLNKAGTAEERALILKKFMKERK